MKVSHKMATKTVTADISHKSPLLSDYY